MRETPMSETETSPIAGEPVEELLENEELECRTGEQDSPESEPVTYFYVNAATGDAIPAERIHWDEPELSFGAVVHSEMDGGSKQYYTVKEMEEDEVVTVHLVEARNIVWKMLFLGALLVGAWFGIDYLFGTYFLN